MMYQICWCLVLLGICYSYRYLYSASARTDIRRAAGPRAMAHHRPLWAV